MKDFADLLRAIAALLWPVVALIVLFAFRMQVRDVLGRLKRGKVLGQEIELAESLDRLSLSASVVAAETPLLTGEAAQAPNESTAAEVEVEERVLQLAAQSPKAALLLLAAEMERELRRLLGVPGLLRGRTQLSFQRGFADLSEWADWLPKHVASSVTLFWDIRNRLVHGHQASDDEILRAIDSGVIILRSIKAIPHETNYVANPGVTVYTDPQGTVPLVGVKGIILETHSPGGAGRTSRIFPTTREHFKKGKVVAWEWSNGKVFTEAWYRDPDTGEVKSAWGSSMEFVGRHLDEL